MLIYSCGVTKYKPRNMKEEAATEEGQMPSGASNVTTVSVVSHQPTALSNDIQLERIRVLEIENGNLKEEKDGLVVKAEDFETEVIGLVEENGRLVHENGGLAKKGETLMELIGREGLIG